MNEERQQEGRLAMRVEGDLWVAYYALPDTMKDAVFLGSIQMAIVLHNRQAKETFMALMRDAVTAIIKGASGLTPDWPEPGGQAAPEHERSGRA